MSKQLMASCVLLLAASGAVAPMAAAQGAGQSQDALPVIEGLPPELVQTVGTVSRANPGRWPDGVVIRLRSDIAFDGVVDAAELKLLEALTAPEFAFRLKGVNPTGANIDIEVRDKLNDDQRAYLADVGSQLALAHGPAEGQSRVEWLLTRRAEGAKELGPLLRTDAEARQQFRLIMAGAFVDAAANASQNAGPGDVQAAIGRGIENVINGRMAHARDAGLAGDDLAALRGAMREAGVMALAAHPTTIPGAAFKSLSAHANNDKVFDDETMRIARELGLLRAE